MKLNKIIIFLFVLFMLGDIITTFMVLNKHDIYGYESEVNPLVVLGIPIWVLIVIKLIVIIFLVSYFTKYYSTTNNIYLRYIIVSLFLIVILVHIGFVVNNLRWYSQQTEEIEPLPKEERIQAYSEQVAEMEVVKDIMPKPARKVPLMFYILLYNFVNFSIWLSFEKGRK